MYAMLPHRRRSAASALLEGLAVGLVYVLFGYLGLSLASVGKEVSLIWAPSGIALAALTLRGRHLAWAVLAAAFLVNLAVGGAWSTALTIGLGNTAGAVLGATLLRRVGFEPAFSRRFDVLSLVGAATVSATTAALVGATLLSTVDSTGLRGFVEVFGYWWAGDALGVLVVAPPLFSWLVPPRDAAERMPLGPIAALATSALLMLLVPSARPEALPSTAIPLLLLMWVALRAGPRWTTTACLLLCVIVIAGTRLGFGPFAAPSPSRSMSLLGLFIGLSGFVSAMLTAITAETRRAEAALAAREAHFRATFEHAPFAMLNLAPDGRIVAANVRLGAMLKTAPATLVGRSIADWVVSKDRAELLEHVGGVLRAGGTTEIECTFERADGEARSVHARIGAMNAAELEDTVLMQLEDVTSWKRAEAERAELTLQLAQAQRLDSIGQLAGGVAHDFNNVLQAISISLELLGRPECSEERRASVLLSARGATERAAGLVRQLLAFSRRDPGEQRVFDVRELVTSTVAMLERLFPANITLTTRLDERPCLIRADWSQLDQLVLNLCLNGRDSIEGDGNVEVSVTMIEERSKVRLEVRDDGAGIPEGLRDRVFEPFFTTKEPGKGTGLGLSVVYGIVQRHLGTIRIAGEAPHGTRVTIDLPAAQAGAEVEPTGAKIQSAVGGSEWILLAEDDLHVREVVAGTLRDAGYRVHVAVDGASAVELFEAAAVTPDAVILDIVMPRMGGREVLARMRARDPGLPALLFTGYEPEPLGRGADQDVVVLQKPCSRDDLLGALRSALARRHAAEVSTRGAGAWRPDDVAG